MKGKRIVSLLIASVFVLFTLAACGTPSGDTTPTTQASGAEGTQGATAGGSDEKVELKVTTIPGSVSKMLQMNKEIFENKYPNVTVTITEFPEDQYQNQAPQIFADKANKPDVAWYWKQIWYNDMANSGLFMPLNDLYQSEGWDKALGDAIVKSYTSPDGNIYAVCDDIVWTPNIYYNKKIFSDLGLSIPKTFEDLYAMADKLKAAGYVPISVGATEAVPDHIFNMLLQRSVTPDQYTKLLDLTRKYDDINYASPEVVSAFTELKKLSENVFQKGATGVNSTEARSMFLQGKAAMYSDGSWAVGMISSEKPADLDVGVFQYPQLKPDIKPAVLVFAGNAMEIMADTKNPEWAKKFLAQVMSQESQGKLAESAILSPARNDVSQESIAKMGDLYVGMYNDMATIGTAPLWFSDQKADVVNKTYELQSGVMSGAVAPGDAAKQLEALFEGSLSQ